VVMTDSANLRPSTAVCLEECLGTVAPVYDEMLPSLDRFNAITCGRFVSGSKHCPSAYRFHRVTSDAFARINATNEGKSTNSNWSRELSFGFGGRSPRWSCIRFRCGDEHAALESCQQRRPGKFTDELPLPSGPSSFASSLGQRQAYRYRCPPSADGPTWRTWHRK
jgi:hypothetical protein